MMLDIWHMDDGENRVAVSYDDQFDSPSISLAVAGTGMRMSAMGMTDICGLMACVEIPPGRPHEWGMSSEGLEWSVSDTEDGLLFACLDGKGGLVKTEVPWEHAVALGIALEKQWGERRCRISIPAVTADPSACSWTSPSRASSGAPDVGGPSPPHPNGRLRRSGGRTP